VVVKAEQQQECPQPSSCEKLFTNPAHNKKKKKRAEETKKRKPK